MPNPHPTKRGVMRTYELVITSGQARPVEVHEANAETLKHTLTELEPGDVLTITRIR